MFDAGDSSKIPLTLTLSPQEGDCHGEFSGLRGEGTFFVLQIFSHYPLCPLSPRTSDFHPFAPSRGERVRVRGIFELPIIPQSRNPASGRRSDRILKFY
jgi:hypothetical protein